MSTKLRKFLLLTLYIWTINPNWVSAKTLYALSTGSSFNPSYLQDYRITINPNNVSLDILAIIRANFEQDPWLGLVISMKNRSLLQYDVNVCQILGKGRSKWLTAWVKTFLNYGNFPISCPIMKGNYSWQKMQIDKNNIPPFMQNGQYEVVVRIYFKKRSTKESISNSTVVVEWK